MIYRKCFSVVQGGRKTTSFKHKKWESVSTVFVLICNGCVVRMCQFRVVCKICGTWSVEWVKEKWNKYPPPLLDVTE